MLGKFIGVMLSPDGGFKARLSNRAYFFCIGLLASVVCSPLAASTDYRAAWLARFDSCRMHRQTIFR